MAHDAKILKLLEKVVSHCTDVEPLKYGTRHRGYIVTTPSGFRTLIVRRKNDHMWRGEGISQSDSILQDKASWGIDPDLLRTYRRKGVTHVMIFVQDTADVYTSQMEDWFDRSKSLDRATKGFGPAEIRHLLVSHMSKKTLDTHWTLR